MTENNRKSFLMFVDSLEVLPELSDEQAGRLFKAVRAYHLIGDPVCGVGAKDEYARIMDDKTLRLVFAPFKVQFERNEEVYRQRCRKRSEAGRIGMQVRWGGKADGNKSNNGNKCNAVVTDDNKGNTCNAGDGVNLENTGSQRVNGGEGTLDTNLGTDVVHNKCYESVTDDNKGNDTYQGITNITDSDSESDSLLKEEEYKEEEKKAVTGGQGTRYDEDVDALLDSLYGDDMFCHYVCSSLCIGSEAFGEWLEKFRAFLHATDEHRKTRRDCKTHFLNWVKTQMPRDRNGAAVIGPFRTPTQGQLDRITELYPECNGHMAKAFTAYINAHGLTPEKGLEHFERAHAGGMGYSKVLFKVQSDGELLYRD